MKQEGQSLVHDFGERRDYLAGEPVHCGTTLKAVVGGQWVWVRYEMFSDTGRGYLIGPHDRITRIDGSERVRWPAEYEQ
jgi:hypothetical protein